MQTKHIEKLEDLHNYEWKHKKWKLKIIPKDPQGVTIVNKFGISSNGLEKETEVRYIHKDWIHEFENFGLKIVLNEKPKLTEKERTLLECHVDSFFIARSENNSLCIFEKMPQQCSLGHWGRIWGDDRLVINSELFPFITWESGKAWSKAELMELEVMDQ